MLQRQKVGFLPDRLKVLFERFKFADEINLAPARLEAVYTEMLWECMGVQIAICKL